LSGIVGIFRRRGGCVERAVLESLTRYLQFRGPDALEVWADGGAVGFGHTMLRTTCEAKAERQPANLGGRLWITADARIDCRSELIEELDRAGRPVALGTPDAELILHAYDVWGEQCVLRLRGDFAFALWDAPRKRLFCARDHFGIKPFFYAAKEDLFLFSNTLNCLRMHPGISDELNEAAIGDFLLFGLNCDLATTTFRDIQRLPAAHFLSVSADEVRTERYWSPPVDGQIRYCRAEEYVEHFGSVLKSAVADRLRTNTVGILLSGGLDSGAVAATARELLSATAGTTELRAYTVVHESFDDHEDFYARQTAERLKIPIKVLPARKLQLFDGWEDGKAVSSEPSDNPFRSGHLATLQAIGAHGRVALSGEGADNLMGFQMWPYTKDLFRRGDWGTLAGVLSRFLWVRQFPWRGLRARIRKITGPDEKGSFYPKWIAPDLAKRNGLAERWKRAPFLGAPAHPLLPRAHASLALPEWAHLFESTDPGETRVPLEFRYPFLDLRVVNYLLALPPFPWLFKKRLLRDAIAGKLPESVVRRAKAPFPVHPLAEVLRGPEPARLSELALGSEMKRFVAPEKLFPLGAVKSAEEAYVIIRPLCLNFWLQSALPLRYNLDAEVRDVQTC
jgi:asparagine synthase (glutamine-hydrolysing)